MDVCVSTLEDIMAGRVSAATIFPYREEILAHGGVQAVAKDLVTYILPEIKRLQGKTVTRQTLDTIWSIQYENQEQWDSPTGYLDYVTDDRNYHYFRLYHGQAAVACKRIIHDHGQAISQCFHNSLHYFILWLGNGHRSANFLRVWALSRSEKITIEEQWPKMKMTFLEFVSIRASHAHHGLLLANGEGNALGFGLNIMMPLVQGSTVSAMCCTQANALLITSRDRQIAFWPKFRQVRKEKARAAMEKSWLAPRPLFQRDFRTALQQVFEKPELFNSVQKCLDMELDQVPPSDLGRDVLFVGSLSAKIGFLLDFANILPAVDDTVGAQNRQVTDDLPRVLQRCHFDKTNALVWTYNFLDFSPLAAEDFATQPSVDYSSQHTALINASHARIILACGHRADAAIRQAFQRPGKHVLRLRGFEYPVYVLDTPGSRPLTKRLLIRCPVLPFSHWAISPRNAARLSELLRFAANMTNTQGLRPYSVESFSILGHIFGIGQEDQGPTSGDQEVIRRDEDWWPSSRNPKARHASKGEANEENPIGFDSDDSAVLVEELTAAHEQSQQRAKKLKRLPQSSHGSNWWSEFRDTEYDYTLKSNIAQPGLKVFDCNIYFPPDLDIGNGAVKLKIELRPRSSAHENMYASKAKVEDPGRRLAFRCTITGSNGTNTIHYPTVDTVKAVFKANTVVEQLEGKLAMKSWRNRGGMVVCKIQQPRVKGESVYISTHRAVTEDINMVCLPQIRGGVYVG